MRGFFTILASVGLLGMAGAMIYDGGVGFEPIGPIMMCDPAALKAGETMDEVRAKCGDRYSENIPLAAGAWYPLSGETRASLADKSEMTWIFGRVSSRRRNVNLYFIGGRLRSVQIFGDGW